LIIREGRGKGLVILKDGTKGDGNKGLVESRVVFDSLFVVVVLLKGVGTGALCSED
jgi:hypothetical protein